MKRAPVMMRVAIVVLAVGGAGTSVCFSSSTEGRNEPRCESLLGVRPSQTIHDIVAKLGSPTRVFLSGEDSEGGQAQPSDGLVFAFDREITLGVDHRVTLRAIVPSGSIAVSVLTADLGDPMRGQCDCLSPRETRDWLGDPPITFRRSIDTEEDSPEGSVGDCVDPTGRIESWLYPLKCIEVQFWDSGDGLKGYLVRIDRQYAERGRPADCAE